MSLYCSHLRVSSHIVHVDAQQMSKPVGHEDGAQVDLQHVLHVATQDSDLNQLLQVHPVSQAVHVSPLHTFNTSSMVYTEQEICFVLNNIVFLSHNLPFQIVGLNLRSGLHFNIIVVHRGMLFIRPRQLCQRMVAVSSIFKLR